MRNRIMVKLVAIFMLLSVSVSAQTPPAAPNPTPPPLIVAPVTQKTWDYLDENAPGSWSAVVYSLGEKPIRAEVLSELTTSLDTGLYTGFSSITAFEKLMFALIKTGQNPTEYQTRDLIAQLGSDRFLYHEGLDGVSMALSIYNAVEPYDVYISETLPNCVPEVISHIGSCQQAEGGFSIHSGSPPSVTATARAVMALSSYKSIAYAQTSVQSGLAWLASQQNEDGTFSAEPNGAPDCEATAAVLSAIRVCGISANDPRFVKNDITLPQALDSFLNTDGGYRPSADLPSSVDATELAVMALYTDFFGLSPYLPPFSYPGYLSPEQLPAEPEPELNTTWFIVKFLGMLFLVYMLLQLTILIGKYAEKKKLPGSLAAEKESQEQEQAARMRNTTFEMHIPMNAALPDFDKIQETETGISPPHDTPSDSSSL